MSTEVWNLATIGYLLLLGITSLPLVYVNCKKPRLVKTPAADIDSSAHFSSSNKEKIKSHYSRIAGALGHWKLKAQQYRYMVNFAAWWAIPSSIVVPVIIQSTDDSGAKFLVTLISVTSAILLAVVQRLKSVSNFKSSRKAESSFYDAFRLLLDDPDSYGTNEDQQVKNYFKHVEVIRKKARDAELESLADIQDL